MYAVVATGGKQVKVAQGDEILVERLAGAVGDKIDLKEVLLVADGASIKTGAPFVKGAAVSVEIIGEERGDKVIVFKKKRRQNYRRKHGHIQEYSKIKITGIKAA